MSRTLLALAAASGLLLATAAEVAYAQASCQSFYAQCTGRYNPNNAKGESKAKYIADHCAPKLASCRQSGCWTEGAAFGGGTTCSLKK